MMTYLLEENSKAKAKREQEKQRGKEEDVAIQQAYIQLLDKQERDRIEEYKRRETRQKENQNRMAENVIKKQTDRQKREDDMI